MTTCPPDYYLNYETRLKRVRGTKYWVHERYFAEIRLVCCTPTSFKFVMDLTVAGILLYNQGTRQLTQYRYYRVWCPDKTKEIQGTWEPSVIEEPPEIPIPCGWVGETFGCNCPSCQCCPKHSSENTPWSNADCVGVASNPIQVPIQNLIPTPGGCKYIRSEGFGLHIVYIDWVGCACLPGDEDFTADFMSQPIYSRATLRETYETDCFDCGAIPTTVTFKRLAEEPITRVLFDFFDPDHTVTFPGTITATLA